MSIKNIVTSQLSEITTYDAEGNITGIVVDSVTANTVSTAGNLETTGNVVGSNLVTPGEVFATGNVNGGNIVTPGQVVASGNITGDNFLTSGLVYAAGDISAGSFTTAGVGNVGTLAVVGNATVGNNFVVTANASAANYATAGIVSATGNVTGGNLVTVGMVAATGNVAGANLVSPGDVDISGNVYANYVFATGNIIASGNVDAGIVNTTDIVGDTVTLASSGANADIYINPNGIGNIVINSSYINGILDPIQLQDAATKAYVDSVATGLQVKASANVATTAGLPAYVYNNGTDGVGATITGNVNGVLTIDTVSTTAGIRVLVKNETLTNAPYNGIYDVTVPGDAGNVYVLTRSSDDDTDTDMYAAYTFINQGATNGATSWTCTAVATSPIVIGTDSIDWVQFSSSAQYSGGNGLSLNGTVFNVNVDNITTGIVGANVVVKASANLVTPNIGHAVGNSLALVGTGNISGGNISITGLATVGANLTAGNVSTGAVVASGNISGANETLSGELTAAGTATAGNLITSGLLAVDGKSTLSDSVSALTNLYVGPTANTATLTGPVIYAQGSANSFSQIGLQSINGNSSADIITYSNNGSDSDGFADLGATGNTFNDTNYTVTKPNDGYFFVQGTAGSGGNLVLATGDVGNTHDIVFATGGFLAANEKMRLVDAANSLQPTANTGMDLGSNTKYFGNLYAGTATLGGNIITTGNIAGNYFIGNGALLTGISGGGNAIAINNGTSNVKIASANGDISMSVANVSNVVTVSTNTLRVNGNIYDSTGQVYGVAASFARFKRTTQQTTGLTVGGIIICNVAEDTFGADITVNTGTGQVTLLAGKSYRLMGGVPSWIGGIGSALGVMWYNETTAAYIGSAADGYAPTAGAAYGAMGGTAEVILTPTVNTVVSFRILSNSSVTGLGGNSDFNVTGSYPWIDVQVIGGQAPLTVGYTASSFAKYTRTTSQTGVAANSVVICNVAEDVGGTDITVDSTSGNITLSAGKSYRLRGSTGAVNLSGGRIAYQWFNVTTAAWIGEAAVSYSPTSASGTNNYQGTAECVITPIVTTVVQLRVGAISGTATILPANAQTGTDGAGAPFIDVEVIGGQMPITNTAQYGSAVSPLASGAALGTSTGTAVIVLTYHLPTAGTWQIDGVVSGSNTAGAQLLFGLWNNSGVQVANTTTIAGYTAGVTSQVSGTASWMVTTTGATSYTVRAWVPTGSAGLLNDATGYTYGSYNQIGGLLPTTFGTTFNTITSITNGSTTTSTTPVLMPGSAFTLSAGTYQLNYLLSLFSNTNFGTFVALWNVTTNSEVTGSATFSGYEGTSAGNYFSLSGSAIVTITTPTVFAVYWASGSAGQTQTVYNNYTGSGVIAQGVGDSTITYSQIGTLPTAIQSVVAASVAKFTRTTSQSSVAANTVIVCNVQESLIGSTISVDTTTGNVTLQAGGTYRLRAGIGRFSVSTARISYQWYNATTSAWIGEASVSHSPTSSTGITEYQGSAECVITPNTTTVVQFKVGSVSGTGTVEVADAQSGVDAGAPFIDVEQIGGFTPSNSITQYGVARTTATDNTPLTSTPLTMLTVNIPAAGTWQIDYSGRATVTATNGYAVIALFDSTGARVSNSTVLVVFGALNTQATGSGSTIVTTAGPRTYTVGMYGVTASLVNNDSGAGMASFTQIAGQLTTAALPALSLAKYTRTTDQTGVAANSVVICNVAEATAGGDIDVSTTTGNITLQANNTYRLRGTVGYCNNTSVTGAMSYQWYNATTGAWVGQGGGVVAPGTPTQSAGWQSGTAEYVFTPTANTVVQLRVVGTANSSIIEVNSGASFASNWKIGAPYIDVEVIGTQAPSSGAPNWRDAGTLQAVGIGGSTTAPTLPTFSTVTRNAVRYKQVGPKTYQLMMTLNVSGGTGGTTGSGDYLFTLPAGLQFDNSIYPAYTGQVQTSSYLPFNYQIPGASAYMNGNTNTVAAINQNVIVPWSATQYRVFWTYGGTVQAWGSGFYQLSGFTAFDTNWQFTFQSAN